MAWHAGIVRNSSWKHVGERPAQARYTTAGFLPDVAAAFADNFFLGDKRQDFSDLLTFTGAPGREYIDANGDTVVVGLNEPRLGNHIDTGSGLFNAGLRFNSGYGEAMKIDAAALARAIGSPGAELWDTGDVFANPLWAESGGVYTKGSTGDSVLGLTTLAANTAYVVSFEVTATTSVLNLWRRNDADTGNEPVATNLGTGPHEIVVRSTSSVNGNGQSLWFASNAFTGTIENLSFRQVTMPAAVSIAIEGYMTYADENTFATVRHFLWEADSDNRLAYELSTSGADTGRQFFVHRALGVSDSPRTDIDDKASGINVPFNYASRHLVGASRGASDGVLTDATTPASMPDLIAQPIQIAPNFNGNITSLTIWADDITNTGLLEATT